MLLFHHHIEGKMKKSPFSEFCERLKIPDNIKNAFAAYLRTEYATRFLLSQEGETVHLMIGRMTEEQLKDAWQMFVKEMARYLLNK